MTALVEEEEGTDVRIVALMSFAASFTILEDAIQNIGLVEFADDEIAALLTLAPDHRMRLVARLTELADDLRESLRELDGRLLQIGSGG